MANLVESYIDNSNQSVIQFCEKSTEVESCKMIGKRLFVTTFSKPPLSVIQDFKLSGVFHNFKDTGTFNEGDIVWDEAPSKAVISSFGWDYRPS